MLDWLIVGGGIHGTHFGIILKALGVNNFRILDPNPELLYNWKWCTCNTRMRYLRSPGVHHVGLQPFDLHKYLPDKDSGNGNFRSPIPYYSPRNLFMTKALLR